MDSETISNIIAGFAIIIQILFSSVECLSTLILASIALFGPIWVEKRKRVIFPPVIKTTFKQNWPFVKTIPIVEGGDIEDKNSRLRIDYALRAKITNVGKSRLKNCEAIVSEIRKKNDDGYIQIPEHREMILEWLTINDTIRSFSVDLNPGRSAFLNICNITVFPDKFAFVNIMEAKTVSDYLSPGYYIIRISFLSDNAPITCEEFELFWSGNLPSFGEDNDSLDLIEEEFRIKKV